MSDLIQIKDKKKDILIGEIGALLHDIGKCHPNFVGTNSIEKDPSNFPHSNIDNILKAELLNLIKNQNFKIYVREYETDVYSLITKHHNRNDNDRLLTLLKSCDRLDSADDKGIIRKKQSKDKTIIISPFGFPKEKIDLQCLKKRFEVLQNNLIGIFQNYIHGDLDIICFRKSLINNLKTTFSHALGETRIPANDVTLWDHSHSTASLYKSILCAIAMGEQSNKERLKWRILGFCWDGIGFINKGRKIADIERRNEIICEIKKELKKKFENEIPIGNSIYEDIDGIYFTFPSLNKDKSQFLARDCVEIGLEIIRTKSDNEIWPFFSLSKASRSLTVLAERLVFASRKKNIPKMTPTLFINENEEIISDNHEMPVPSKGEDICPVCKFRSKPEKNEICNICEEKRIGRLKNWLDDRKNTIWMDEVADKDNRVALLSLSFNLEKWFDGTMIGTIYSQSFEDWRNSEKWNKIQDISIKANKNSVYQVIDELLQFKDSNKRRAAELINTFFEENIGLNVNSLDDHLSNIKERIGTDNLTKENLSTYLFTQDPSPARLYRIWKETEEFFELVIKEIITELYSHKWKRINFKIDNSNFKLVENTPYIIKLKELEPENLVAIHISNGEFYTIESLDKFKFRGKSGADAVQDTLINKGLYWLAEEDNPDNNLLQNGHNVRSDTINKEQYYPFIEITKSPLLLRLVTPASDSMKILELIVKLYCNRFEKVLGKLPLDTSLLVYKRKFPLYVLLDAGERLLNNQEFKEPMMMDVLWDINGLRNDKYYGLYPIRKLDGKKYNLEDLIPISKGKPFALYPGYFDFDLLFSTADKYNMIYKEKRRTGEDYNLFSNRPYYLYQIFQIIDLWEIIKNNLSSTQINFVEETLTNKLREWRNVKEKNKGDIFRKFAEATLKVAFENNWEKLRKETQDFIINVALNGLLLDTIILFRHTIKEGR